MSCFVLGIIVLYRPPGPCSRYYIKTLEPSSRVSIGIYSPILMGSPPHPHSSFCHPVIVDRPPNCSLGSHAHVNLCYYPRRCHRIALHLYSRNGGPVSPISSLPRPLKTSISISSLVHASSSHVLPITSRPTLHPVAFGGMVARSVHQVHAENGPS
ncbi:hypothetical protein JAAARDRAFT_282570 [Jaapia argillacea MUCL 33604]|uniref:Uncharacterized protein n=1 Tax=Jaapia argillacea MUCL 33604 TaxID=933084 RepID=A0A067PQH2_9AGAM|nr:hypothetical protein JAAARDRAFT_282570 [Jaapia argillacea MUCL 33604]